MCLMRQSKRKNDVLKLALRCLLQERKIVVDSHRLPNNEVDEAGFDEIAKLDFVIVEIISVIDDLCV